MGRRWATGPGDPERRGSRSGPRDLPEPAPAPDRRRSVAKNPVPQQRQARRPASASEPLQFVPIYVVRCALGPSHPSGQPTLYAAHPVCRRSKLNSDVSVAQIFRGHSAFRGAGSNVERRAYRVGGRLCSRSCEQSVQQPVLCGRQRTHHQWCAVRREPSRPVLVVHPESAATPQAGYVDRISPAGD